jgi:hypothetical protein
MNQVKYKFKPMQEVYCINYGYIEAEPPTICTLCSGEGRVPISVDPSITALCPKCDGVGRFPNTRHQGWKLADEYDETKLMVNSLWIKMLYLTKARIIYTIGDDLTDYHEEYVFATRAEALADCERRNKEDSYQ